MMTKKLSGLLAIFTAGAWLAWNACSGPKPVDISPSQLGGGAGGVDSEGGTGGSHPVTVTSILAGTLGTTVTSGSGGQPASTEPPTGDAKTCGTSISETKPATPDILIVLDRTASMTYGLTADTYCTAGDPSCSTRLDAVKPAVGDVVTNNPGINWGLELFLSPEASSGSCTVNAKPQVAVAQDSATAIKAQLASLTTGMSTPTASALKVATDYLSGLDDGNKKAILLATDGQPNCPAGSKSWQTDDMSGATAAAKAALAAGFPVYVIGIGPSVSNLTQLADAGGTTDYYPATSIDALSSALSTIAKAVATTCTFKADTPPDNSDLVYVYVDRNYVGKDDSNGWVFESSDPTFSTVTLTGSFCDDMLAGNTTEVKIVFGCPNLPPPPIL